MNDYHVYKDTILESGAQKTRQAALISFKVDIGFIRDWNKPDVVCTSTEFPEYEAIANDDEDPIFAEYSCIKPHPDYQRPSEWRDYNAYWRKNCAPGNTELDAHLATCTRDCIDWDNYWIYHWCVEYSEPVCTPTTTINEASFCCNPE